MPMVATGSGAIDVMSKLLQDRILMLNGQAPGSWMVDGGWGVRAKNPAGNPKKSNKKTKHNPFSN
jgi:hypothetical protein